MGGLNAVLSWIYPERCAVCSRLVPVESFGGGLCPCCGKSPPFIKQPLCPVCGRHREEGPVCPACHNIQYAFERVYAVFDYETVKSSIRRFKYGGVKDTGRVFSGLMARFAEENNLDFSGIDMIVPVPLHKNKQKSRGFNQSEIIAHELGRCLGISVKPDVLVRIRETMPQSLVPSSERRANVRGSFKVLDEAAVSGRKILLLDDIFTSGSTADECARALLRAGADNVVVFALSASKA